MAKKKNANYSAELSGDNDQAPDSQDKLARRIHKVQSALWMIQSELKSYSFLFTSLSETEVTDGDLYGVGVRLDKLQQRLEKISNNLSGLKNS